MTNDLSKASGVDLDAGNRASAAAAKLQRRSYGNNHFMSINSHSDGHFRGLKTFSLERLPQGTEFNLVMDGNGTKPMFNVVANRPEHAGYDLVAMTCGDITRKGGLPLGLINQLDVSTLGSEKARNFVSQLHFGLANAMAHVHVVGLGGETAEMNQAVGSEIEGSFFNFNWCAAAFAAYHPHKTIRGDEIRDGQVVIALAETYGLRCNGSSTVRLALRRKFGERWWEHPGAIDWIAEAAAPSTLYDLALSEVNGWWPGRKRIPVSGIVHVTGGGIPEKLGNLLAPLGLSADLYNLHDPTALMLACADWLEEAGQPATHEKLYDIFNGGQGALVILDEDYVIDFRRRMQIAEIDTKIAGRVFRARGGPFIRIHSRFRHGRPFEVSLL